MYHSINMVLVFPIESILIYRFVFTILFDSIMIFWVNNHDLYNISLII